MELMTPYYDLPDFNGDSAKRIAGAAEGLCSFVRAMYDYHNASLIVAPRLKALQVQTAQP